MSVLTYDLHLGDTPNYDFGTARYCGLGVDLPILITNRNTDDLWLTIRTSAIETLAAWQKHTVTLNGSLIGMLADINGVANEEHRFTLPAGLITRNENTLSIRVGAAVPGLIDDFVLREIELEGADLRSGWTP
jgi:hypothetical protein